MDLPTPSDEHFTPTRARLFTALAGLRRPATTKELAHLVGRHPNSVRVQLQHLERAGLVACRRMPQPRGRPKHAWAVVPGAGSAAAGPEAHRDLSRWLARALHGAGVLVDIEAAGREIGRELAPDPAPEDGRQAMQDTLTAMGFDPRDEPIEDGYRRYVLGNCPYRDAVAENPAAVCTLHRGITQGLLDRLDPKRRLTAFVAKDPFTAGCLIEVGAG